MATVAAAAAAKPPKEPKLQSQSSSASASSGGGASTASASNRVNYDLLLKSVRTIQSHWRGYAIRKLYRDLKLDMATKAMQFGYFCEQVCACFLNNIR